MSRPGLYFLVFLSLLHSCSADMNASRALKILEKQAADGNR